MASRVVLVVGEAGTGKSTWLAERLARYRERNIPVGGVLCPPRRPDHIALRAQDLRDDQTWTLAARNVPPDPGSATPGWRFSSEGIERANLAFTRAENCPVLFVDELGPLEFVQGSGYREAVRLLDDGLFRTAFVAVRPSLLKLAQARWPHARVVRI